MLIKFKKNIVKEIFYFLSAALILFVLSEIIWPNSVLAYVNINYAFVLWVISWLLLL
jgi:hypothetical protein